MRKLLTRLLVFLLAVTSVFGLTGLKSVKAEEVAVSGMQIVGASLRSPAGEDAYTGIRFETTITKEAFNALKEANEGKVISFGTKISDVDGFSPVYVSYVTSENMAFVEEGNNYKYYASITFNNEDFALDVLKMLRNDDTLTTIEGATEEELLKIEKYKQASYAELLKATSYYEIDGTKYYTASLIRSMRMVANWYVEGDILNETEKAFISSKNYFTAVTPITGYNYVEQDGEIVNDNGEAYVFATKAQVAYKAQNVPVVDGKLDLSNVAFDEELGEKVTLYIFDEGNKVSELTAKYVTEYITTVAEMKKAVEIGDLSAEIAAEGYYAGNITTGEYGDLYNDGYYVLGCDLDFTGYKIEHAVTDINTSAQYGVHRPFVGTFDGQGYALKNVEVVNGVGIFGQISHKANIKNLAIIDYNFPAGNGTPMGVLAFSESVDSDHDTGGAVFEDLYITLGTLNNNDSKWRRRGMLFGQLVNPRTVLKNIVVEANVTHTTYESYIGQPTLFYYANNHVYIEGKSLYQHKASNSTSIADSALANSIENLFVISKDITNSGLTFRMTAASSGNPASVAYNDKDTANVIETNAITSSGSYYWPEYYYTDSEGNATFVKPENYEGANNIVMRRYDDYTAFASDTKTDKTSLNKFTHDMWVVSNGAVYYKNNYKNIVTSVVKNNANEVVDEIIFDESSDYFKFNFKDSADIDANCIKITLEGDASSLAIEGNKVYVNGTLPAEGSVVINVEQEISGYKATASYTATLTNVKYIDSLVYFDASTGKFDTTVIKGTVQSAIVTYDNTEYALTVTDGLVEGVTVENRTTAHGNTLDSSVSGYKLYVKTGESEGAEVGFVLIDDGDFNGASVLVSTDSGNYSLTNVEFVSKVIKTQGDLAVLNAASSKYDFGYYVLGNNIEVEDDVTTENVNEAIAINHANCFTSNKAVGNFNGIFDGKGYTITNLELGNYGMFSSVGALAIIRNFALNNVKVVNVSILAEYLKTQTIAAARTGSPSWLQASTYPGIRIENLYIKLSSNSSMPKGLFGICVDSFVYRLSSVIVDWQDAPTVTVENGVVKEGVVEITSNVGLITSDTRTSLNTFNYAYMLCSRGSNFNVYTISNYPLMYKQDYALTTKNDSNSKYYVYIDGVSTQLAINTTFSATKTLAFGAKVANPYNTVLPITTATASDIAYMNAAEISSYSSNTALASGIGTNLATFTNNAYWDTSLGYPVWESLPQA